MTVDVAAVSAFLGAVILLGAALALLREREQRVSATASTVAGFAALVAAGLGWQHQTSWKLAAVLGAIALLLALTTYPVPDRTRVGQCVLVFHTGCGSALLVWRGAAEAVGSLGLLMAVVLLGHLWWRIEQSAGDHRRALQWLALTLCSTACVVLLMSFAWEGSPAAAAPLALLGLVGPAMWLGVRSPDLVDVRAVVVRVVVRSVTVLCFVAVLSPVLSGLAAGSDRPLDEGAIALLAAVLALLVPPFQSRLHRAVDELLFGPRPDPLRAAGHLAREATGDPDTALAAIRRALSLPYVALVVADERIAESGERPRRLWTLTLDEKACVESAPREGALDLDTTERGVLLVAGQLLNQSIRARALAADLARSREQTVQAREEERRRLRNELHDDVGPRLAGVASTVDAAYNMVPADPVAARDLLTNVRGQVTQALDDIRVLVYGMRPPSLDELGLVGAVRQLATTLRHADGRPLTVTLHETGAQAALPAAVEVAAYRILAEGLRNVARHTEAEATVRVTRSPGLLELEVRDCAGDRGPWQRGVGLRSMEERAEELGGTLTAGPGAEGGAVRAVLPLPDASDRPGQPPPLPPNRALKTRTGSMQD